MNCSASPALICGIFRLTTAVLALLFSMALPPPAYALLGSSTAVTSSVNPSTVGSSVTFTAMVTGVVITPTGTVTFKDGATTIGTATLDGSGQASMTTSTLAVGSHSITAVYGGDLVYNPSTSPILTQTVNQAASTTAVTSSVNPSTAGQSVTFTATVSGSAGTATGTVTFKDGATTIGSSSLSSGQATLSTSALTAGSHSITAVYGGDTNYTGSTSPVLTQTVNQATSSTAVTSSLNPSTAGQSVTFTATVSGSAGTATGTVTFKDGATTIGSGSLSGGQATLSTSALTAGSHSITAVYGGDTTYTGSTSPVLTQTVNQAASSTAVVSSLNPSAAGQSITLTATVSGSAGTATGTVTFKDGATTIGSGSLSSGQATLSTNVLAAGSHSITAVYGGDTNYTGSTSPILTQTVNQAASTTAVTSSLNPSTAGQSVTFTATVSGSAGTATGTVTFKDGATTIGSGTLDTSGQATLSISALTTGSHSITAVYGGDTNYATSTSPVLTQTVNQAASTTAVTSSANPSAPGQSITFTATVSGSAGTATGTVTFKDGATTIGSSSLSSGQATLSTSTLTAGSHSVTAIYGGSSAYATSTSPVLTQTVNQAASTTALTSSVNPSAPGQSVTFTATVSGSAGTATGTVTFKDGATTIGSGSLSSGQATLSTSSLTAGSHSITAVYGGSSAYATSTSPVLTQTVNQAASTTAVTSSANPSAPGQSITFTATVSGSAGTATGTVTFKDGATTIGSSSLSSGQATLSTSTLTAGSHSVTAIYGGSSAYAASTSPVLTQTVNQAASTIALITSVNPSTVGQSITFTATVGGSAGTATGTVTFKDGATTIGAASLSGGQATFSTSTLSAGNHSITAAYGGDSKYGMTTSTPLVQSVSRAADSTRLRKLQEMSTDTAAQLSAQAIAGAMDRAVEEGLAEDCSAVTPNGSGFRIRACAEPSSNARVGQGFTTLDNRVGPFWSAWADLRGTDWNANDPKNDLSGRQVNGTAGITIQITRSMIAGALGGYEIFNYNSAALGGYMRGDGWTAGAYYAWRLMEGIRFDAGIAYTDSRFSGTAGNASASFRGVRWLIKAGLTGRYSRSAWDFEPSARVYMAVETDDPYIDSFQFMQAGRHFMTGRASVGGKLSYHWRTNAVVFTPWIGLYGDHYLVDERAGSTVSAVGTKGSSARLASGLSIATPWNAVFSLEANASGLGSKFYSRSLLTRVSLPF